MLKLKVKTKLYNKKNPAIVMLLTMAGKQLAVG
jgi:hypothetical protein